MKKKILSLILALVIALPFPAMLTACDKKSDPPADPPPIVQEYPDNPSEDDIDTPSQEQTPGDDNPSQEQTPGEDANDPSDDNPNDDENNEDDQKDDNPTEGDDNPDEDVNDPSEENPSTGETHPSEENPDGGEEEKPGQEGEPDNDHSQDNPELGGQEGGEDYNNPEQGDTEQSGSEGGDPEEGEQPGETGGESEINPGEDGDEGKGESGEQSGDEDPEIPQINLLNESVKQTLSAWVVNDLFPFDLVDVVEIIENSEQSFSFTFITENVMDFKLTLREKVQSSGEFVIESNRFVKIGLNGKTIIEITDGDVLTFRIYIEPIEIETEWFLAWSDEMGLTIVFMEEPDAQVIDLAMDDDVTCKILGNSQAICSDIASSLGFSYDGEAEFILDFSEMGMEELGVITLTVYSDFVLYRWSPN